MALDGLDIGTVPWTRDDLIAALPEFEEIYAGRPIAHNEGGMRAPHAFLAWFFLRALNPSLVIESGVWRGQGTWLIEMACPKSDILCLDPTLSQLAYRSKRAGYTSMDFSLVDLQGADPATTVCLFDDHQNAMLRLHQMAWKGLRWAIFDDNFPPGVGDCYSLKQALSGSGFEMPSKPVPDTDFKSMVRATADRLLQNVPRNDTHAQELRTRLRTYYEGPPLVGSANVHNQRKDQNFGYPTKPALLESNSQSELAKEPDPYIYMCLAELYG